MGSMSSDEKCDGFNSMVMPVDLEVERTKRGFSILKEDVIKCADCGKRLVDIIKVKEDDDIIKVIKAICPCGGSSFLYEIVGHTYIQASNGVAIGDMPTDIRDGVIYITIEVIKT